MKRYWQVETYTQLSADELREKAIQSMNQAAKKGKTYEPVIVSAKRGIAQSWWGNAWCENLERYADFASRIERGKRYVRTGTVVDLNISKGKITARVQGRRKAPYKIDIHISPLKETQCQAIIKVCTSRIQNLESLVLGTFPDDLKELFVSEHGLFPAPREISFQCSCPDWAIMCKHVAAVLYGIGVRMDENPFLLFTLRGIDLDQFIDVAISNKVEKMLDNANQITSRVMDDADTVALFGFDQ